MNIAQLIYQSYIWWPFSCFQFELLWIMLLWTSLHLSQNARVQAFQLVKHVGAELMGQKMFKCSIVTDDASFPKSLYQFRLLLAENEHFCCSPSLPVIACKSFYISHSDGYIRESPCSLSCIFPIINEIEHIFLTIFFYCFAYIFKIDLEGLFIYSDFKPFVDYIYCEYLYILWQYS